MPTFEPSFFLLGCLGGLLPDLLRLYRNKYNRNIPAYIKSPNFWLRLFIAIIIGGVVVWLFEAQTVKDALAFGYAAPQLLSQLAGGATVSKKKVELGEKIEETAIRNWWAM